MAPDLVGALLFGAAFAVLCVLIVFAARRLGLFPPRIMPGRKSGDGVEKGSGWRRP